MTMNRHIYFCTLAFLISASVLTSCFKQPQSTEDIIRNEFQSYVQENYDDPNNFVEITSMEFLDTICKKRVFQKEPLEIIKMVYETGGLSDYDAERYNKIMNDYKNDNTIILPYKLKVRRKDNNGNKYIVEYQAWYDTNNEKVIIEEQTPSLKMNKHLPQIYQDFYDLFGASISYMANH